MRYKSNGQWKNLFTPTSTGLKYQHGNHEVTPTGWSIVQRESQCKTNSVLYFIAADPIVDPGYNAWGVIDASNTANTIPTAFKLRFTDSEKTTLGEVTFNVTDGQITEQFFDIDFTTSSYCYYLCATSTNTTTNGYSCKFSISIDCYEADGTKVGYAWFPSTSLGSTWSNTYGASNYEYAERVNYYTTEDGDAYSSWEEFWSNPYNYMKITIYLTDYMNTGTVCLEENTLIRTSNGPMAIKDISVGDKVIDKNGEMTEVLAVYGHKADTIYNITLADGEVISATGDHRFITTEGVKETNQLFSGDKLASLGNPVEIQSIEILENQNVNVYEIATKSNTYGLNIGILCECEGI